MSLAIAGYFPALPRPVDKRVFPRLVDELRKEAGAGRSQYAVEGCTARDWTGCDVGFLHVIRRATRAEEKVVKRPGRYVPAWVCRCECGRTSVRLSDTLRKADREGRWVTCGDDRCQYRRIAKSRR